MTVKVAASVAAFLFLVFGQTILIRIARRGHQHRRPSPPTHRTQPAHRPAPRLPPFSFLAPRARPEKPWFYEMNVNTASMCATCTTEYLAESPLPELCPICNDDRQYIPARGMAVRGSNAGRAGKSHYGMASGSCGRACEVFLESPKRYDYLAPGHKK